LAGNPSNAARLGILPAEVTKWSAFAGQWSPLYSKYTDAKGSRTTAIKDQIWSIMGNCVKFDRKNHILDRISASPQVTITDMETFNIKKGALQKTNHSKRRTPLEEPLFASIRQIGGGNVAIKCRSSKGGRAAVFTGADSIQFAYLVGDTAPASADAEGIRSGISTKASIILTLGSACSHMYLHIYFRWYLTKHPDLAGPWNSMQTIFIL